MNRADASASPGSLAFDRVSRSFPGVKALDGVSFVARPGRVHALMGENGAGKSTLLKVLGGVYAPDAGSGGLTLGERRLDFGGPADALAAGVAVIQQELQLVDSLSVAENVLLGRLPRRGPGWFRALGLIDRRAARRAAADTLTRLGEGHLDVRASAGSLSPGPRQMVEIAKAIARDAAVIAFDEPTSSLSAREADRLFAVIAQLRAAGRVIFYVTHRMDEVFRVCDACTVLRDGRHVRTWDDLSGASPDGLVRAMVGRPVADVYGQRGASPAAATGTPRLSVRGLTGPGLTAPADLDLRSGEITGLFGLVGAGRTELVRLLARAERPTGGAVTLDGDAFAPRHPAHAIGRGVVLVPEDRKRHGILPVAGVGENINVSARRHHQPVPGPAGVIGPRPFAWERRNAAARIAELNVRTPGPGTLIRTLSGGNQQKAILARWLSEPDLRVVLFDEPTRGIDVGARAEIYRLIRGLAARGVAVLVVSSELPEALGLSDRLMVMEGGRMRGELAGSDATPEAARRLA